MLRINATLPARIDPAADAANRLYDEIFPRLTVLTDDSADPVAPDLAASITALESGRAYEIVLRRGLALSDGSPLQVHDVKRAWERALRPRTGSPTAFRSLGAIRGAAAVHDGLAQELVGVEIADDRTRSVRLAEARPDFPILIAH